jgi:phosphatidate cytidylyltransferase
VTRVISAAILVAVVGGVLLALPWMAALALAALIAALAASELAGLSRAIGAPAPAMVVVVSAVAVCAAVPVAMTSGDIIVTVLLALVAVAGVVTLSAGPPSPAVITVAAVTMMVPLYVGLPLGALAWVDLVYGPHPVIFVLAVVALSDSAQYFAGRAFGRRKLAPAVSPAKTIEGAVGGLLMAAATGAALGPLWGQTGVVWHGAVLGLVLGSAGILGDLFESMLKRSASIKDSSALIPGHGGVLDRIDAYLFAVPVYVMYLRYFG